MFQFFKEKLKSFFKKTKKEVEEKIEEQAVNAVEETKEVKRQIKEKKKETTGEKADRIIEEVREKDIEITPLKFDAGKGRLEPDIPKIRERIEEESEEPKKKEGFFARLKHKFETFKISEENFEKIWQDLELVLLENNLAIEVIKVMRIKLRERLLEREIKKNEIEGIMQEALKNSISDLLINPFDIVEEVKKKISEKGKPAVIVFFGINGSGKTTTIAKVVSLILKNKLKCVLAASDTFRAASIEQIQKHATKLGVKVIKHDYGADAAAVSFDAIQYAKANDIDIVLIDTAGRMHTEVNLMREMEKICKVSKPDFKIFIGESTVGNDMIEQAKTFNERIGIDGIILTKADVDEKGGSAISASYITKKPILLLGTGQEYSDLEVFNKEKIIKLLGFN